MKRMKRMRVKCLTMMRITKMIFGVMSYKYRIDNKLKHLFPLNILWYKSPIDITEMFFCLKLAPFDELVLRPTLFTGYFCHFLSHLLLSYLELNYGLQRGRQGLRKEMFFHVWKFINILLRYKYINQYIMIVKLLTIHLNVHNFSFFSA